MSEYLDECAQTGWIDETVWELACITVSAYDYDVRGYGMRNRFSPKCAHILNVELSASKNACI